jgi:hypothetical protein
MVLLVVQWFQLAKGRLAQRIPLSAYRERRQCLAERRVTASPNPPYHDDEFYPAQFVSGARTLLRQPQPIDDVVALDG